MAAFGVLFLFLAIAYTFHHQEAVDRRVCVSIVENRQADRAQWLAVQVELLRNGMPDEAVRALINAALRPIPPLECRNNKPVPKGG